MGLAAILGFLEALSRLGVVDPRSFPPISEDVGALVLQLPDLAFWEAVAATLEGWALGLGVAVALAVPLGILLGSLPPADHALRAVIEFLRPIPSVALIPLAILLYGLGVTSEVFLVAFASFWPLLIQTLYGVRDVDPVALETSRAFGDSWPRRAGRIVLPSALPYLATGLRIASATALILAVTAELIIGSPGLGREIEVARSAGAYSLMYGLIIATGVLGWGLDTVLDRTERQVLHWHPLHRGAEAAS
ncbi:MAG TPA: ABC transporter permease [Candidatus Dormibacteraeota bacterium]|jgi:ABC-type nitrate/sulfonate/bicarbonate transport system permease component|nr:ABC transporter permease [Candidatus Dormibacteraeota bacterium]